MLISEINPFIRYASRFILAPPNTYQVTEDCRIFFVLDTEKSAFIQIGFTKYEMKKNTLFFISANTPYKFTLNGTTKVISINFDFTQYRNESTLPFEIKTFSRLSEYKPPERKEIFENYAPLNSCIVLDDSEFLLNTLDKIVKEYAFHYPYFRETSSAMLKLLLINVIATHEKATLYTNPYYIKNEKLIRKVKKFIHEHYKENLTNDIIAHHVDYHSYHLNRIFRKFEGISIHKYLNNYRIIMAEKLLLETDESVTFIATEVGFDNATSFTQNFKAKNSTTPLKYRNRCRKIF